jgi:hypothetical protein
LLQLQSLELKTPASLSPQHTISSLSVEFHRQHLLHHQLFPPSSCSSLFSLTLLLLLLILSRVVLALVLLNSQIEPHHLHSLPKGTCDETTTTPTEKREEDDDDRIESETSDETATH